MTDLPTVAFPALARFVASEAAYRELWTARRLLEAASTVVERAQPAAPQAPTCVVASHDLALLRAAVLLARGERARSRDGFPHLGRRLGRRGRCEAGDCPCHDGVHLTAGRVA